MKKLFNQLFGSKSSPQEASSQTNFEACPQCGHDFNAHLLKGYGSPPTEGWMECPVEGCECANTWSLDAASKADVEKSKQNDGDEGKT